jgi:hypothetical protein
MLLSMSISQCFLAGLIMKYFQCPQSNWWSGACALIKHRTPTHLSLKTGTQFRHTRCCKYATAPPMTLLTVHQFNLGWKIALVEKGLADKSLLETYNAERLPVISEMLEMTTTILNQSLKTNIFNAQRGPILFMLGINCRFSNIVLDEFAIPGKPINAYGVLDEANLEAGDRAPDAPNMLQLGGGESDAKTLFSLYRPWYHTVLVFAPSPADATPVLGALDSYEKSAVRSAVVLPSSASVTSVASPADLVFVDQKGHAYSAYLVEAGQTKVFVIRPDGVVGAIVRGAEGVKKYFSGIFSEV